MKSLLLYIIIIFLFISCEEPIYFETPQPKGEINLKEFPTNLQGTYLSTTDDINITINRKTIVEWANVEKRVHKDSLYLDIEIDSTKIINAIDTLELKDTKFIYKLFFEKDSVLCNYFYRDTLFYLSKKQILRVSKDGYLLSSMKREGNWKVKKLTLQDEKLTLSNTENLKAVVEDIVEVEKTESNNDKIIYKLNPSKIEFNRHVNDKFTESQIYLKVE
jgi:hypothetical protein